MFIGKVTIWWAALVFEKAYYEAVAGRWSRWRNYVKIL